MKWAIEMAPPMPAQLVATLTGLAYHADKHGRGAFPSVARLAAYTCKSERSVQRDLKDLRKLGLIRFGDQSKAAHLPPGKRPDVYDLAMERTVPKGRAGDDEVTLASRVTLASSRRRGGRKKPSSDAMTSDLTGDAHVTGDADVRGDAHVADGVTPTSQEGRRPRHPNQKIEPKEEPSYHSPEPNSSEQAGEEERTPDAFAFIQPLITAMTDAGFDDISWQMKADDLQAIARVLKRAGVEAMVKSALKAKATARTPIRYATYFLRAGWAGLPPKSTKPRKEPSSRPEKPPYCGDPDCDPITRTRDKEIENGLFVIVPCPHCHPDKRKNPAA